MPSKTSNVLPNQTHSQSTKTGLPGETAERGVGFGEVEERELGVQADPSPSCASATYLFSNFRPVVAPLCASVSFLVTGD